MLQQSLHKRRGLCNDCGFVEELQLSASRCVKWDRILLYRAQTHTVNAGSGRRGGKNSTDCSITLRQGGNAVVSAKQAFIPSCRTKPGQTHSLIIHRWLRHMTHRGREHRCGCGRSDNQRNAVIVLSTSYYVSQDFLMSIFVASETRSCAHTFLNRKIHAVHPKSRLPVNVIF